MIFKSSDKAVNPKVGNIRNTEKPIQTFTVTKKTFRSNDLKSVLWFCVTSFCAAVRSDLKINFYEKEFPPPCSHTASKGNINYKTFCHVSLIKDAVNNTSPYLQILRNSGTRSTNHTQSRPTLYVGLLVYMNRITPFFPAASWNNSVRPRS
jgi:hypothetical protein